MPDRDAQTILLAIGLLTGVTFLGGLKMTVGSAHPVTQEGSWDLVRDREGRLAQVVARPLLPAQAYSYSR